MGWLSDSAVARTQCPSVYDSPFCAFGEVELDGPKLEAKDSLGRSQTVGVTLERLFQCFFSSY